MVRFPVRECALALTLMAVLVSGCRKQDGAAQAAGPGGPQAMPVQVSAVVDRPVAQGDTYVATIKSRRSASVQPQVDGNLTRILVKSGDVVKAGQLLMVIDPLKQQATVAQQKGLESQARASLNYNRAEANRQRQLFEAGVISRDAYEQAMQNLGTSTGTFNAAVESTRTQQQQLAYYQIRAPFSGVVGDIPVHQGDYVSTSTLLTTVDDRGGLEAYIYIPTERAAEVHVGLPVDLLDTSGETLLKSRIAFVSPEVDNGSQTILAKAEVPATAGPQVLRNQQLVKARVTWSTQPVPVVPVLSITRVGGQAFVFVAQPKGKGYVAHQTAVTLGESIGNTYPVLSGLRPGDKVIVSGLQMMAEGMPVQPLG